MVGRLIIAPWLDRISAPVKALVLGQIDVQPDDVVLEAGFGGGGLLAMIHARTAGEVIGIDPSEAMVDRARRRMRKLARLRLHVAGVESIPLADASVDKACSVNNLYFWSHPEAGMRELVRVTRPGGRIIIAFEPPEALRKWPGHRFGFRVWEIDEVRQLMEQVGLDDIRAAEGAGRASDRFCCLTGERIAPEAKP